MIWQPKRFAPLCLLVAVACSEATAPQQPLPSDAQFNHGSTGPFDALVGHWKMDGNAMDDGPNGLHGSLVGSVPADADQDGDPSGALRITPPNHMAVAHTPLLNFSGDFTLMFWMKTNALGAQFTGEPVDVIAHKGRDNDNTYEFFRGAGSDVVNFYVRPVNGGPVMIVAGQVPLGAWHHVAVTVDNGIEIRMYMDGVLKSATPMFSTFAANNVHPLVFGRHYTQANGGGGFEYAFDGALDVFRAYGRVIEACELGLMVGSPCDPPSKDACKNGGWETYAFKNQGQCVRYVESGKDSRA